MALEFPAQLPRYAFTTRDAARAGDIWRCCQEVAVHGSTLCGWPPSRYREEGSAFVVRSMTVLHFREPAYGESVTAQTWVANFRRGILTTREIRLATGAGRFAAATQEWVHVSADLRPVRASAECQEAFAGEDIEPSPVLPASMPIADAPIHRFEFDVWNNWMDPLGHANHPMYLDWCEESTSRPMRAAGLDPVHLQPVGETVAWKLGVAAPDRVTVETQCTGVTEAGAVVLSHRVLNSEGKLCATSTTVRTLADGDPSRLRHVFE